MRTLDRFDLIRDTDVLKICAQQFHNEKEEVSRSSIGHRTTTVTI